MAVKRRMTATDSNHVVEKVAKDGNLNAVVDAYQHGGRFFPPTPREHS